MPFVNFSFLGSIFKYSYLGVDLFFIISGFVIVLSAENRTLWSFAKARVIRLYPAYWLSVSLTFATILWLGKPQFEATFNQFIINLTMFQRVFGVKNIDGLYWSLVVELRFYFIIALYLILSRSKMVNLNKVMYVWLLLAITHVFIPSNAVFEGLRVLLIFNHWRILLVVWYCITSIKHLLRQKTHYSY